MSAAQAVMTKNSDKRPDCPTHTGIRAVYLCETCNDSLACGECVVSLHQGHRLVKAADFLTMKKESLQKDIRRMEDEIIPTLRANLALVYDTKMKKDQEYNNEVAAIRLKNEKLKEEIDEQTDELIKECGELHDENMKMLEGYTSNCKDNLAQCYDKLCKLKETLPTLSLETITSEIFNFQDQKLEDECRTQVPECREIFFVCGEKSIVKVDHIGKIFAKEISSSQQATRDITEKSSFAHTSGITLLHSIADDKIWTSYSETKEIQLMDPTGNIKATVKTKLTVDCCCVAPITGNVWMCSSNNQSVYEIPSGEGPPQFRFKSAVSMPLSMCILQDGTVLLGGFHGIKAYSPRGSEIFSAESPRKNNGVLSVIMQMFKKEEEKSTSYVVIWPRSIRQCSGSGDVAVSDWDSRSHSGTGKPRVIVFNCDLELKFRYCGSDEMSQTRTSNFMPFDACFDKMNDLLIADYGNKSVHLVSGHNGCLLKILMNTELRPKSLSLSNNILWLALENRNIKVLKYCS